MEDNKDLLKELEKKFEAIKKELGFQTTFEELNSEFNLGDSVLSLGFVSENYSRQLCSGIVDYFRDWHGYLNNLLIPNSSFYASQTEARLFQSKEEQKKIWELIKISMKFSSMHSLIGLSKDKQQESRFVDEAYAAWTKIFSPGLKEILTKIHDGWIKE